MQFGVGTRVPSTISTVSPRKRLRSRSASRGPSWLTTRSAADFEIPNKGANCRKVRLVRRYAATSNTRSSSGRLHGRPLWTKGGHPRRSMVISFPNCFGLSPEYGATHNLLRRCDHNPHREIISAVVLAPLHGPDLRARPWICPPRSVEPAVQQPWPEKTFIAVEGRRVDLLQLLGQLVQLGESHLFLVFGEVLLGAVRLTEKF